jgi:hypothetical protein
MPTTQPEFKVLRPMSAGEMAAAFFGTLRKVAIGLPWWCYAILIVAIAARLIVGKPLGR